MNNHNARRMMYDWHSGQSSALYAAASSGLVQCTDAVHAELREAQAVCKAAGNALEYQAVGRLRVWVDRSVHGPLRASDGRVYLGLPWYKPAPEPALAA